MNRRTDEPTGKWTGQMKEWKWDLLSPHHPEVRKETLSEKENQVVKGKEIGVFGVLGTPELEQMAL